MGLYFCTFGISFTLYFAHIWQRTRRQVSFVTYDFNNTVVYIRVCLDTQRAHVRQNKHDYPYYVYAFRRRPCRKGEWVNERERERGIERRASPNSFGSQRKTAKKQEKGTEHTCIVEFPLRFVSPSMRAHIWKRRRLFIRAYIKSGVRLFAWPLLREVEVGK